MSSLVLVLLVFCVGESQNILNKQHVKLSMLSAIPRFRWTPTHCLLCLIKTRGNASPSLEQRSTWLLYKKCEKKESTLTASEWVINTDDYFYKQATRTGAKCCVYVLNEQQGILRKQLLLVLICFVCFVFIELHFIIL